MSKWIGVDFDETLRRYDGSAIEPMVARVKQWLSEGIGVRIITARMCPYAANTEWAAKNGGASVEEQEAYVKAWCLENIGVELPVQWGKGPGMIAQWDDKVVTVEANTGRVLTVKSKVKDLLDRLRRGCDCEYDHRCGNCQTIVDIKELLDS